MGNEIQQNKLTRTGIINALARRPWNADTKRWSRSKLGESFGKTANREGAYYSNCTRAGKQRIWSPTTRRFAKITGGWYAAQIIRTKNYSKDTDAYAALRQKTSCHSATMRDGATDCSKMLLAHFHHVQL